MLESAPSISPGGESPQPIYIGCLGREHSPRECSWVGNTLPESFPGSRELSLERVPRSPNKQPISGICPGHFALSVVIVSYVCVYLYMYIHTYIYIYIYICMHSVCVYIHIYIYIHTSRSSLGSRCRGRHGWRGRPRRRTACRPRRYSLV